MPNRSIACLAAIAALLLPVSAMADTLVLLPLIPGQIITSSSFDPAPGVPARAANRGEDVPILETQPADRQCQVLGMVNASARMLNLLSSRPTHADVDVALRREAMRHGADTVIEPRYISSRTGLVSAGRIRATAKALYCQGQG
jgi:hypothetical protein